MKDYSAKLKDPRWQKKRLKILERDAFKCLCCSDEKTTLHVHHLVYSASEPWEEPDENLETLCEDCHTIRESFNDLMDSRTKLPTKFIYMFLRWSTLYNPAKFGHLKGNHLYDFMRFIHFCGPEFLSKTLEENYKKQYPESAGTPLA